MFGCCIGPVWQYGWQQTQNYIRHGLSVAFGCRDAKIAITTNFASTGKSCFSNFVFSQGNFGGSEMP